MSSEPDRIKILYILLVFISGIILYLPSINIPFLNDEIAFITRNQADTFSEFINLWDKKDYDGDYYRPAGNFTSGLLTSLIGFNSTGYRIFNLLLHSFNGVLVFIFISLLLSNKERHRFTPLFGAIFFIAFPLNDYSVIWHTDLFDRIMMFFYLLSVIYYLKKNKPGIVSVLFFLLSLLSKEMALSLPIIILLLSYYRNHSLIKSGKHALPYLIVVLGLILFRWIVFNNNLFNLQDAHAGIGIIPAVKNVFIFLGMLVFPFFLREIQDLILTQPLVILFPVIVFSSGLFYWIVKFRRKDLMLFLLISIVLITILPASRLLMRWYMYLPSAGFAALLSYVIFTSKFEYKKLLLAAVLISGLYYGYTLFKVTNWIKISTAGANSISLMVNQFSDEIEKSERIIFLTLPAKVNDIPLFQLGFDHHLNYHLRGKKNIDISSKSYLSDTDDKIKTTMNGNRVVLEHTGDNYFILSGMGKNIKFSNENFREGKLKQITYLKEKELHTVVFTFSEGKFHLIKE